MELWRIEKNGQSRQMKIQKLALFIIVLAVVLCPQTAYAAKRHHHTAHHPQKHHAGAGVDRGAGYSDIVIEADTGRIIHTTDADSLRHPASLTKMMTMYITFQALEAGRLTLDQSLPVSENASYQSPSKLGLRAGHTIRVQDAILGVVTESANDAAVVLGEALGGSEDGFAQLMTKQAHALGMTRTLFRNPSGLPDPEQVTTAHDMAVLGAALITHYPQFYPYFDHDGFSYAGIYHHNHNHLKERYEGMDGIKTGYIRASGFNLVASAKHGNLRLIGVVFGGKSAVSRDNHMAQLLDESFDVAQTERRKGTIETANGEGDGSDESGGYVALPSKISAVFPSRTAAKHPASTVPLPAAVESVQPSPQQVLQPSHPVPVSVPQAAVPQPPQAVPVTQVGGNCGVQIGAYSDAAIGRQSLAALVASTPNVPASADQQIQPVSVGGTTMYRARLMSLDSKTAHNICAYFIQRGKSCLTVEP